MAEQLESCRQQKNSHRARDCAFISCAAHTQALAFGNGSRKLGRSEGGNARLNFQQEGKSSVESKDEQHRSLRTWLIYFKYERARSFWGWAHLRPSVAPSGIKSPGCLRTDKFTLIIFFPRWRVRRGLHLRRGVRALNRAAMQVCAQGVMERTTTLWWFLFTAAGKTTGLTALVALDHDVFDGQQAALPRGYDFKHNLGRREADSSQGWQMGSRLSNGDTDRRAAHAQGKCGSSAVVSPAASRAEVSWAAAGRAAAGQAAVLFPQYVTLTAAPRHASVKLGFWARRPFETLQPHCVKSEPRLMCIIFHSLLANHSYMKWQ